MRRADQMNHSERQQRESERDTPNRTVLVLRPEFRVTEVELPQGTATDWHRHTSVDDTFYVLEGRVRVALRDPDQDVLLERGQSWGSVPHGRPHEVSNAGQSRAVVLVMQGFGVYDFLPSTDREPRPDRFSAPDDRDGEQPRPQSER